MNIIQDFLKPNRFSRPQVKIKEVKGVVIHWTANPLATAKNNRDYFNNLNGTYASAHYIIGLDGEKIQCIPEDEIAYHAGSNTYTQACKEQLYGSPNFYTLGIELCPIDLEGHFNQATLDSCIELVADIDKRYNLSSVYDTWTHKEVIGWKDCPRYFVNNPDEWEKFKLAIEKYKKEDDYMDANQIKNELGIKDAEWKQKQMELAEQNGIIREGHITTEVLDMGTVCAMLNNLYEKFKNIN